jgi:predicted PurR-regulated permease PerM
MPSEQAIVTIWGVSLVIAVVVVVVVGILLALILRTAEQIEQVVGDIWTAGQRVANNTVHIPLLSRTNGIAGQIVERAVAIDAVAAQIEEHAGGCPRCPQCALGGGARS